MHHPSMKKAYDPTKHERNAKVFAEVVERGREPVKVAKQFKLSRQRVAQIVWYEARNVHKITGWMARDLDELRVAWRNMMDGAA